MVIEEELIQKLRKSYEKFTQENCEYSTQNVQEFIKTTKETVPSNYSNKTSYLFFNAIFDVNIAKNVEKNKILLVEMFKALNLSSENTEIDILLNLEVFLLKKNASIGFEKYIPTILQLFYKEELLSDEVLVEWDEGKLNAKFMMDFRYDKMIDNKMKEASRPFLDWIK